MLKLAINYLFAFFLLLSWQLPAQKTILVGNIQFPSSITTVPNIRVYYAGHKIPCENRDDTKKVIFSIPEHKERTIFYLLISADLDFFSHENTVPFLKLKKNSIHKFYILQRVPIEQKEKRKKNDSLPQQAYTWLVKELPLNLPDERIPDETIIIRYHSEFVQGLEGGNAIEFPKIIIKNDFLALVGSEEKLHQISNKLFFAALNTDTIHEAPPSEFILTMGNKALIATAA